jgi:hypothetical protein
MCEFFFNRTFPTGAIGGVLFVVVFVNMISVRPSSSNQHKRARERETQERVKDRSISQNPRGKIPHFTWRVVNEYESIKRHVDIHLNYSINL